MKILLVTDNKSSWSELAQALAGHEKVEVFWADSGRSALELARVGSYDLVAADQELGDMTGLELAGRLLEVNAMINSAVVSPLSPEEFHEAGEGLGLLAQLSPSPGPEEAEELVRKLKKVPGLQAGDS
ncbi:MAG: response regulator [Pseudomonadota bacterium]